MKLKEGQQLWFVGASLGNYRGCSGAVTVTKVGRKWAELSGQGDLLGLRRSRLDVSTLLVDGQGYSSPGRCYASRQDWLNIEGPKLAWAQLRQHLMNQTPEELSFEAVQHAAALLGCKIQLPGQAESDQP